MGIEITKNYIDENLVDLGPHKARPLEAMWELPAELVGKAYKVENDVVVLDETAEAARLAAIAAEEAAAALVKYKSDRQAEYPTVGDQLDAIYKKEVLGDSTEYDAIAAEIAAVKVKYPKP